MTNIWGFDFGAVTGISHGFFGPNSGYRLLQAWEIQGGTYGFNDWCISPHNSMTALDVIVAEKFILANNQFVANIEGVPAEGILVAHAPAEIFWQDRTAKAGVKDEVLKRNGWWQDGFVIGHTDGRDANDAIIHSVEWLRRRAHEPTLRLL